MDSVVESVLKQNRHWQVGARLSEYEFRRKLFERLWRDRNVKLMTFLTGARRTGKSVILKQIVDELVRSGVGRKQILYFEFKPKDDMSIPRQVFDYFYSEVTNNEEKLYVVFDELQYIANYEVYMKEIYDLYEGRIKFFVTGSLSLLYKKRMQESLVGRFLPYRLMPLSFREYLGVRNDSDGAIFDEFKKQKPIDYLLPLQRLNTKFRFFLASGRYAEMVGEEERLTDLYLTTVSSQSLSQDAFAYFQIYKPQELIALYEYLRLNSGGIVSLSALKLGASFKTTSNYLEILEALGIVYVIHNSIDPIVKLNSAKKIYVNSAFYLQVTKYDTPTAMGIAAESYVLEQMITNDINPITFFRDRDFEVDFVDPRKKELLEVKFRKQLGEVEKWKKFSNTKKMSLTIATLEEWGEKDGVNYVPACMV